MTRNFNAITELISLSQLKFQLITERKVDDLENVLHDNSFILTNGDVCESKVEFIGKIEKGELPFEHITVNKATPKLLNGSAIVWGEAMVSKIKEPISKYLKMDYTEVYFKVGGFWRMVFANFNFKSGKF